MIRALLSRLARDERGATILEFALIAPVLFVLLFGLFDLSYNLYTSQMLNGAIQKAARDSTIEGAASNTATLDGIVTKAVQAIVPGVTPTFSRKSYSSFSNVSRPENYDDVNNSGTCDTGETFEDANGNGTFDKDTGNTGFGGARDAVLYTVTVTYKRPFPVAAFIPGQSNTMTMSTTTVLRNQPYGLQAAATAPKTGTCT